MCDLHHVELGALYDELHRDHQALEGIRDAAVAAAEAGGHCTEGLATLIEIVADRLKTRCDRLDGIVHAAADATGATSGG
jgi:hypothetical protein